MKKIISCSQKKIGIGRKGNYFVISHMEGYKYSIQFNNQVASLK